ncbi:hypothetical protein [Pengzhenrongella phosphoraccumulans]|uniref:hypothetical protein n=1 Tax=Pengzhenrongella phosphoraccumulans TaxID=3114394 RepID=UPI0038901202
MVIAIPVPLDADAQTPLAEGPRSVPSQSADGVPGVPGENRVEIRLARLADIPAIARITQEGPPPEDIEPEVMSQATRMLLTLVAYEHGALWIEEVVDGPILRAVIAIPACELPPRPAVMRDLATEMGILAAPHKAAAGLGKAFLAELAAIAPAWVLIEISKAAPRRTADPALLGAALAWTRAQPTPDATRAPVIVLADSFLEREVAVQLGFLEHRTWGHGWPWWLGVAPAATPVSA